MSVRVAASDDRARRKTRGDNRAAGGERRGHGVVRGDSAEASLGPRIRSVFVVLAAAGQLLWAAQGVTSSAGERTAPSAGALYPLEVYLVAGSVDVLPAGVYRYRPQKHALRVHLAGDRRRELGEAALGQTAVSKAPAVLVVVALYARTARKYGVRAERYVHIEAGHVAQNVYLQAQVLGLGTVIVGAFEDDAVRSALELPQTESPLALLPVGTPRP